MIRVFVNLLPFYLQSSTDINYARSLGKSSSKIGAFFYYPHKWSWGLKENLKLVINKFLSIIGCRKRINVVHPKEFLNSEFNEKEFDIVYSQGTCPQNSGNVPLFIESGLWRPGQNKAYTEFDEHYFTQVTIPLFQDYLKHNSIVNLKSNIEIENAKQLFPCYKNSFVKIPFLLPDLIPISQSELLAKHKEDDTIRIGFVGGQANRKGLPALIQAYQKVKLELKGIKKMELHIISGYNDGNVYVPKGYDIKEHGKLPYGNVLQVMKTWHIFAMVSNNESYGLVYIEAMANGCINIVRDFYPQREFVDFGKIGFLAFPDNIESISKALKDAIMLTRDARISMAVSGLEKFNTEYEYTHVVKQFREALNKCASLKYVNR
ncbi:glycosyl transferase group 1 [Phocaeicola salanitronis DSM 18170]|uniref:Glycosyl transferase group 1 n=1 Tax=Phocaeicola salanitronis (strain DSM 18170 / JCM 13657 / CCUG 60908 / BL78) TaxID=667015 RepID=F0R0E3_PHOSB|nr:glycosyltransferase family 4 protein [Phocaeicola salanitronis]ADY37287.1 glycosyl transferase group 1 [Phocaeicola salanitronis DSM 18170]